MNLGNYVNTNLLEISDRTDLDDSGVVASSKAVHDVAVRFATCCGVANRTANDVAVTPATLPPAPSSLPLGSVTMFSGSFGGANNKHPIPTGSTVADTNWHICDGSDNTPDLQGKFVVGTGAGYSQGDTGGNASASVSGSTGETTLTEAQMPLSYIIKVA